MLGSGRTGSQKSIYSSGRRRVDAHHDEVSLMRGADLSEPDIEREKLLARTRAVKVLDYAMQTEAGTETCERFVEVAGLKSFFSIFMGKVSIAIRAPELQC